MGLKVVMIGPYPLEPGAVRGGIEAVTSTLVPALAERDDIESVTVLRFHQGDAPADYRREGPKVDVYYLRGQDRFRTLTGSYLDVRRARKLVKQLRPDIVHGQEIGWFGDVAAKSSPNCVVTVHGLPHVEARLGTDRSIRDRLRSTPIDMMVRRVLRRAKVVISISSYDEGQLETMIHGRRVSIANPTAMDFFDLAPSKATGPRLLFAGVLTPRKNPEGILEAFARVNMVEPTARLVMVGPQPNVEYAQAIRDRVTELGLQHSVDEIGFVDNDRLRREIVEARAVVMFSREETAPTIIAQAMAAGKPVVASRVGGVSEMVADGETGFLVESEDVAMLTKRMLTLIRNQDLCLRMGRAGHNVARERFMPDAVARLTAEAYRTAVN